MKGRHAIALALLALVVGSSACASAPRTPRPAPKPPARVDPFAEVEEKARSIVDPPEAAPASSLLVRGGTVMTAAGARYEPGFVLVERERIVAVGPGDGPPPKEGTVVVDAKGKFVTPGIIDPHSHMGVYPAPATSGHEDGNEATDPVTAGVRAEDSFWPNDPAIERAVAGGVTTVAILPGSANLIGGRGVTLHLVPQRGARAMRFPGAPEILKMACGENPKRVYGGQRRAPTTRMANVRGVREALLKARKYLRDWEERPSRDDGKGDKETKPPDRDLALETLALVLRGDILVQWHCYQADDMLSALQIADEFGFRVRSFHHALEAYKIRDVLARRQVGVSTWDDWWGFKMEAYDGIPENLALIQESGGRAALHSDSPIAIQVLNQAAGKAAAAGRAAGIDLSDDDVLRWLTANPAWVLGIDEQVGTLQPGKRADLVIWNAHPFSTYARAERVYIDGRLVFERGKATEPWSDFEIGVRP